MTDSIASIAELEAVIGKAPPVVNLKVIDHLDASALRWIAASPFLFAGFGTGADIAITLGGGTPGFADGDRTTLRVPLAALDDPGLARPGLGFGSLFLAPGIGETLRVNGRVAGIQDGAAHIVVEQCYGHCAKALIRSAFWSAEPLGEVPADPAGFAAASRFLALATIDPQDAADLSPKGDPAGSMAAIDGDRLWFADRPGNRRTDSFRNLIVQPRIAAALIVPGSTYVAIVRGAARLTTDEAARTRFAVQDKTPLLATRVEDMEITLHDSGALARARLWPLRAPAQGIEPARMFAAHVKLNKDKGMTAKLAGALLSIPGLMQRGLDKDYKSNLY